MLLTVWHAVPWILVVVGSLILEIVIFVALSGPRMAAIEQALDAEEGPLSQTFKKLVNHPILWISAHTRTAILLGIVFLKIAKPDLRGSLLAIGMAIALGLASALPVLRQTRRVVAFFATTFAAALVLLAANSISASTIPASQPTSDVPVVQPTPTEVQTEVRSAKSCRTPLGPR